MNAPLPPDWQELRIGRDRWRVRADWRDALCHPQEGVLHRLALRQPQPLAQSSQIHKQAQHRLVYATDTREGTVFIKHYFVRDLRAKVRSWLRPPKAFLECDRALAIAARGVPTVEPVAAGVAPGGSSCLVTLAVPDAVPLDQHLLTGLPRNDIPWQRQMTQELAAFVARLHDAGVTHQDFHPGNILLHHDELGLPSLTLIDPYEVRLGQPLDLRTSLANLTLFGLWFLPRTSPTDRFRFWRYYWLERQELSLEIAAAERELLPRLGEQMWQQHLQHWRQREHRYLGDNRDFYRLTHAGNQAWAVRDLAPELLAKLLADPDAPFTWPGSRLLKDSPSSTVAEVALPELKGERPVIYKRFLVTKPTDPVLGLFRDTPALKSWRNGQRLLEVGLPTARPLAVLHRRKLGLTWECFLLTEKLPHAVELQEYAHHLGELPSEETHRQRCELADEVARLLRRMHRHQVSHHDLKAANILVSKATPTASPQLFLIDLYGVKRWRKLPRSEREQNLMRLYVSFRNEPWFTPAVRLRFLRVYLRQEPEEAARWKEWWRSVAALARRKVARNQRRGRPLS